MSSKVPIQETNTEKGSRQLIGDRCFVETVETVETVKTQTYQEAILVHNPPIPNGLHFGVRHSSYVFPIITL